jgi:riboflavin synthase
MFTGIIETLATIQKVEKDGTNIHFYFESTLASELKVDQSVAHNGVCLTVVDVYGDRTYRVTAIDETLKKTNLSQWGVGSKVNAERCMQLGARLDGHIVQGHVDQIGTCISIEEKEGSWIFTFTYDAAVGNVTVEKGSITVNGTSLTVVNSLEGQFSVAIIPYTYAHTNFHQIHIGDTVNLEFDVIGKYVARLTKGYK